MCRDFHLLLFLQFREEAEVAEETDVTGVCGDPGGVEAAGVLGGGVAGRSRVVMKMEELALREDSEWLHT